MINPKMIDAINEVTSSFEGETDRLQTEIIQVVRDGVEKNGYTHCQLSQFTQTDIGHISRLLSGNKKIGLTLAVRLLHVVGYRFAIVPIEETEGP
jgi:hypothetical protein